MKIVVTGGCGLLGHFVVEQLREQNEVTAIDRVAPREPFVGVDYRMVDVLDLLELQRCLPGHDALIHLAGIDAGNPFPDEVYFQTNVQGTWNVLHAAESAGICRAVIASSSSVYGLDAETAPDYLPVDETHPLRPTGVYALSKVLMETTAASFARRGAMRVICLRPAHIMRPQTEAPILVQIAKDDHGAGAAARLAQRLVVEPYGELPVLRGYVRSRDAARAFALATRCESEPFAVFNVAAVDSMGGANTVDRLQAMYGAALPVRDDERYQRVASASVFDSRLAAAGLGWLPVSDWRDLERSYAE